MRAEARGVYVRYGVLLLATVTVDCVVGATEVRGRLSPGEVAEFAVRAIGSNPVEGVISSIPAEGVRCPNGLLSAEEVRARLSDEKGMLHLLVRDADGLRRRCRADQRGGSPTMPVAVFVREHPGFYVYVEYLGPDTACVQVESVPAADGPARDRAWICAAKAEGGWYLGGPFLCDPGCVWPGSTRASDVQAAARRAAAALGYWKDGMWVEASRFGSYDDFVAAGWGTHREDAAQLRKALSDRSFWYVRVMAAFSATGYMDAILDESLNVVRANIWK